MNDDGRPNKEESLWRTHRTGFLILLVIVLFAVLILRVTWMAGQQNVMNGLLKEGLRVRVNRSLEPGEGRLSINVWEPGMGWVPLYR